MTTLENSWPMAVQQTSPILFFHFWQRTFHFYNHKSWLKEANKSVFLPNGSITLNDLNKWKDKKKVSQKYLK